jgi:hypothetical protein
MVLPAGFTAKVYVSGEGFDGTRAASGIPSSSTLAFDPAGVLYLARNGRRYQGGEVEDLWPVYRVPRGGRLGKTPRRGSSTVRRCPILRSAPCAVATSCSSPPTTAIAGSACSTASWTGAPTSSRAARRRRAQPLLKQPEGVASIAPATSTSPTARNVVVQLDPAGRVLDARWLSIPRPRLIVSHADRIWVSSDGDAEAPWQRGTGRSGASVPRASLALRGPSRSA